MKLFRSTLFLTLAAVILACGVLMASFGPAQKALAQGMLRLSTFTSGAQITGIGSPCTTSCYVLVTSTTVTLNGATPVTVTNAAITANSTFIWGLKTVGGTVSPNGPAVLTVTPGTGFTVGGTALDTSTYNLIIFN